jgi:putative thiazole-containing bacteriocin maturation protein
MLTQNMQPKFNADTCYIPILDGVYLRGNSHGLILKGKSLYRLLEHLVPNLNGNSTLEELTDGLDPDRKKMIINLLEKLSAHHFLKDVSQDQLHTLRPVELATYSTNITFIESFRTSAAYQFECFRNKHFLIIGSGLSFTSLVQASLQCGVRQIDVIVTPESEIDSNAHTDLFDLFSTCDSEQTVHLVDVSHWDDEAKVLNIIQVYDAILHISDRPMLARAQLLNRLCIEQQKTFIQAVVVDDHAWIGPLVSPETGRCWECAWRRLQSNLPHLLEQLPHYEFHDQPTVPLSRFVALPTATIAANRLTFELFKHFTQTGSTEIAGKLIDIDLATLLSESHPFLPHPHCRACQYPLTPTASQFLEQIQQLQHQRPINLNIFFENMSRCIDEKLGLFTAVDNDKFAQAPLAVYKINLSNIMLTKRQSEILHVIATSTDTTDARLRASQRACERYAVNLVDRRRLLSHETIQQYSLPAISPNQLLGIKRPLTESETWIWGLDLHTQQAYLAPATQVFFSPHNTDSERGIASGMNWEEAICQALLDWCNYLTVEELKASHHSYIQVDLAKAPMTPEGTHLHHLLKTTGRQITVYDVTGTLQVPTFAICSDEKVIAYSTHCDVAQALRHGLEQALQQYQSEQFQQPEYAIPMPDFSPTLRNDQLHVPRYILPEAWPARLEWLLQKLQTNCLHAFAIPLDHDPALAQVFPYIVRVLLTTTGVKNEQ